MGGALLFSFKSMATSAAVVSAAAVVVRLAGPPVAGLLAEEVPRAFASILAWLAPPYLYLVINLIILSIAASSSFAKPSHGDEGRGADAPVAIREDVAAPIVEDPASVYVGEFAGEVLAVPTAVVVGDIGNVGEGKGDEDFVISRSNWKPERREEAKVEVESPATVERPLVLERFGRRRSVKASPEGKALRRVSAVRPKRNETLESTWRTITEGRAVPLARHLKKSDTFDGHTEASPELAPGAAAMRKSETFNASRASSPASPIASPISGGGRLRREPSLGQDELNRRVEAFIRKFNEEMRLQRQESFKQYMEMVSRK